MEKIDADVKTDVPAGMVKKVVDLLRFHYDELDDCVTKTIAEDVCRAVLLYRE